MPAVRHFGEIFGRYPSRSSEGYSSIGAHGRWDNAIYAPNAPPLLVSASLCTSTFSAHPMRAVAILGWGCSSKDLKPFQDDKSHATRIDWCLGMPASGEQADVVLLFGGDGTIHRHLGPLVRLGLPVLVAPAGSGNDFARSLGLRRGAGS